MNFSRRDLALLLPVLATAAEAQQPSANVLPSRLYHAEQIAYTGDDKKKGRQFFLGKTHGGFNLEMHETILGPGMESHPPHKHVHEEIILLVEGTAEFHIEDKTDTVKAGSVVYFGSNEMHSGRNAGTTPCRYYVLELRADAV